MGKRIKKCFQEVSNLAGPFLSYLDDPCVEDGLAALARGAAVVGSRSVGPLVGFYEALKESSPVLSGRWYESIDIFFSASSLSRVASSDCGHE